MVVVLRHSHFLASRIALAGSNGSKLAYKIILYSQNSPMILRRKMERSFEPQGLWIPSLKLWWVHMVFMCSNWSTWQGWVLNQNVRAPPKFSEFQLGNFSCCFRPAHSKFCCDLIQIFLNSFHQLHLQWKTVMQIFRNWSFSSMISSSQKLKTTFDVDTICQSAYHAM